MRGCCLSSLYQELKNQCYFPAGVRGRSQYPAGWKRRYYLPFSSGLCFLSGSAYVYFLLNYMLPLVRSALLLCGVKFCLSVLMYLNGPFVLVLLRCLSCDIPVIFLQI